MHVFYLHGFASSTRSSKATFFARKLHERGIVLHTPDLNEPDFSTLTITRMIEQVTRAIEAVAGPVALIGSSLGGFVAVQVAVARPSRIDRLVLLAPALDFGPATGSESGAESIGGGDRRPRLGDRSIDDWKRTNQLNVFHYGYGRMATVHYGLYADACGYDCVNAPLSMPIQIFQGRRDEAVDPGTVERWARSRPNVELHMLDDDHQLAASIEYIWREMERFLELRSR